MLALAIMLVGLSAPVFASHAQVLTQHNDNARTGANLDEDILNPASLSGGHFGKLFTRKVDGQIYAQPLFASDVMIDSKFHDLVIVATEHNTLYAFDARNLANDAPVWQVNLGPAAIVADTFFKDDHTLMPEIGITGTPVIDGAAQTIFVSAFTQEPDGYHHRLHAVDLATGNDLRSVEIQGDFDGVTFDPLMHRQRPALLLSQGVVHIAMGSQDDHGSFHGWMFAYDSQSFERLGVFCTSTEGDSEGSIWMAGQGPAADEEGSIYFMTGNGEGVESDHNLADAFVRLALNDSGYALMDWFAPYNYAYLNEKDLDLGSSGPLLIPGTSLLVGGGKVGKLFVLDRGNMGHTQSDSDSQIVQSFQATKGPIFNSPVYWNSHLFLWAAKDRLREFEVGDQGIDPTPSSISEPGMSSLYPGGLLSISARGNDPDSGIVWALRAIRGDGHGGVQSGMLQAFGASDVSHLLWSSEDERADAVGDLAKFSAPTIANGRVYVPTFSNELVVYGLKN